MPMCLKELMAARGLTDTCDCFVFFIIIIFVAIFFQEYNFQIVRIIRMQISRDMNILFNSIRLYWIDINKIKKGVAT